ncbi:MAG: class I SAM-dependent methyltransferase [Pseudomonadales bacterium]
MDNDLTKSLVCDLCGGEHSAPFAQKFDLQYVECKDCGFVYSDVRSFDFSAHNAATMQSLQETQLGKHGSTRYQKEYQKRLREFEPYRKTNRFLEVGCSAGAFLRVVHDAGWEEYGVEPETQWANYCLDELGLNVHVGTLETADYQENSFDVVYSNAVIEHLVNPSVVIEEAFRILRPGGLLYADTVNLASYTWKFLGSQWKLFDPRMHLSLYTPETLRRHCEAAGFRVRKIATHGVRFHATRADQPRGWRRVVDELRKTPYSIAARRNLKGDNICVYAEKPVD